MLSSFRIPSAIRNPHHVSGTLFAFQMERKTFLNDKYIQLQAHAFLFSPPYIRVEQQRRKVYQTTILCCLLWFEERSIYIITIANISIWKTAFCTHTVWRLAPTHRRRREQTKKYKIKRAISFGACCECGRAKLSASAVPWDHSASQLMLTFAALPHCATPPAQLDQNEKMYNHFVYLSFSIKMGTKLKWNSQNKVISFILFVHSNIFSSFPAAEK